MVKDKIIQTDNNHSYYILEELDYNDKKYVLAAEYDEEQDDAKEEDELHVMEIRIEDDSLVTKNIHDDNIARIVTEKLIEKVRAE